MQATYIFMLASGIALFLFGMTLMGDSLKKMSGSRLEPTLYRLSKTPLRGILLGVGVTSVLQSSCATSVMAVGFVNAGMMELRQESFDAHSYIEELMNHEDEAFRRDYQGFREKYSFD